MVAAIPASPACRATAWAWLPADMATTPARRSAAVSRAMRLAAPRSLNEPIACRLSSLSVTCAPVARLTASEYSEGVRMTRPAIRAAAACTSASPIMPGPVSAGSPRNKGQPKLTDRISYVRSPPGAGTDTVSPTFLLISDLASGEEIDRRACFTSASCMPTIW